MPRSLRTGLLLLLLTLSAGCRVWNESSAPLATPAAASAAPTVSAAATRAVPTPRATPPPAPTVRRLSPAPRPVVTASRTGAPVVRRTLVPPAAPPPPGLSPYEAPTVAATRFLGCPLGDGGGWTFTAEVDLVGGSHWTPMSANLQHTSGDTYRYVMPHIGGGSSAPPPAVQQVTWRDVGLWGSDGSFHDLVFPTGKVITASCPS